MRIQDHKEAFVSVLTFLKEELSMLRTGRASTAMVESISVEAYGTHQPLKATASITVPDPKTVQVEPWDKSLLGAIEKAIRDSGLGINPVNDGRMLRLTMPELTHERRQELIKVLHQKLEQARISIRKVREELRTAIAQEEKDKAISEDEKFRLQEELEKAVKEYNEEIKHIGEAKEKDILTV